MKDSLKIKVYQVGTILLVLLIVLLIIGFFV